MKNKRDEGWCNDPPGRKTRKSNCKAHLGKKQHSAWTARTYISSSILHIGCFSVSHRCLMSDWERLVPYRLRSFRWGLWRTALNNSESCPKYTEVNLQKIKKKNSVMQWDPSTKTDTSCTILPALNAGPHHTVSGILVTPARKLFLDGVFRHQTAQRLKLLRTFLFLPSPSTST